MPEKTTSQEVKSTEKTNSFYIDSESKGTIKVVEHFSGNKTYSDIIKAALHREFGA